MAVNLSAGKALALLVYLALTRAPLERDDAARLLWPTLPRERARQSTRQALWVLRRELGGELFEPGEAIALVPGAVELDAVQLEELLRAGALEEADRLWQAPLLAHFALPGVPAWDEWVESERARLGSLLGSALLADGVFRRARGDLEGAERRLRRAAEIQPYALGPRVELIEALLELGRPADALEAIAAARREVPDSGEEVALLEARVLEAVRLRVEASERHGGFTLELVGRSAELSVLTSLWKDARRRLARRATISGPAGIGKSRLADEICAIATLDGRAVTVKAYEGEARLEYGFAGTVARRLLSLPGAAGISAASEATLAPLVPSLSRHEFGERPPWLPGPAALADALADLIAAVAFETPLLLVLDDVHWADVPSVLVLARALRVLREEPVLAVVAYRTDEIAGQSLATVERIEREDGAKPLRLRPLAPADVDELLAGSVEAASEVEFQALSESVYAATAGNPLFVVEVLRGLREDGAIVRSGDTWRLVPGRLPQRLTLPASIETVLDRRMERLEDPAAAAVVAALAGLVSPAPPQRVQQASGLDDTAFAGAVRVLTAAEIVTGSNGDLVFVHDRIREAARRRFPPLARRRRTWRLVGAVAVAGALTLIGGDALLHAGRPGPRPFGGGTIYLVRPDSAIELRLVAGGRVLRTASRWPLRQVRALPFRMTDGALRWIGTVTSLVEAPYVVEILPNGRQHVITRTGGDSGSGVLSPDGRWILFDTENLATPQYDVDLVLARSDGSDPRRLYRSRDKLGQPAWSPGGQAVAVAVTAPRDTLAVLSPDGRSLRKLAFDDVGGVCWADENRLAILAGEHGRWQLVLARVSDGGVVHLPPPGTIIGGIACSPDGSAAALLTRSALGRLVLRIQPLNGGPAEQVPLGDVLPQSLQWLPDTVPPVRVAAHIVASPGVLRWGERRLLAVEAEYSDHERRRETGTWTSSAPAVASVSPAGELTGNGPGEAWIDVTVGGWLRDSIHVSVRGEVTEGVLLREHFDQLARRDWWFVGSPAAVVEQAFDGRPALYLNGDGRYTDGVVSARAFALPRGGTLELQFALELTRRDRQRVEICLGVPESSTALASGDITGWSFLVSTCFLYPSRELLKFDSRAAALLSGGATQDVRLPHVPRGWTRLALQLRADGHASVYLDGRLLGDGPLVLPMNRDARWRIGLFGAAVDTHAWVRDVVLWDGPRY